MREQSAAVSFSQAIADFDSLILEERKTTPSFRVADPDSDIPWWFVLGTVRDRIIAVRFGYEGHRPGVTVCELRILLATLRSSEFQVDDQTRARAVVALKHLIRGLGGMT